MKLLVDTHIFLWFISGDPHLPDFMRAHIRNRENEVYLSVVSIWEAIVKYQLGKLPLPAQPATYLPEQREKHQLVTLPLDEISVMQLPTLQSLHRDPFDRMLICQALAHRLTLVTIDAAICQYAVSVLRQ